MGSSAFDNNQRNAVRLSYRSFSFHGDTTTTTTTTTTSSSTAAANNSNTRNKSSSTDTSSTRSTLSSPPSPPSRKRPRRRPQHNQEDVRHHNPTPSSRIGPRLSTWSLSAIFLSLGVGVLLPWNAYIMAKPYFASRLTTVTITAAAAAAGCGGGITDGGDESYSAQDDQDELEVWLFQDVTADSIEAWFSLLFNGGSVLSLAILIALQFCWYREDKRTSTSTSTSSTASVSVSTTANNSSRSSSNWYLVMVPLAIYLVVFIGTTILVLLPNIPPLVFWSWTFLGFTVCGICTSIASAGIVSAACRFPNEHVGIHPYFHGQAVGGLWVALGSLAASYIDGRNNNNNNTTTTTSTSTMASIHKCPPHEVSYYSTISWPTAGYFAASCVILAACMVGYSYVDQYLDQCDEWGESEVENDDDDDDDIDDDDDDDSCAIPPSEATPLLAITTTDATTNSNNSNSNNNHEQLDDECNAPGFYYYYNSHKSKTSSLSLYEEASTTSSETISITASEDEDGVEEIDVDVDLEDHSSILQKNRRASPLTPDWGNLTIRVIRAVWGPALSLFVTFFVTLAIFPVWTSELSSIHPQTGDDENDPTASTLLSRMATDLFTPMTFVIFNAGDLVGRMISSSSVLEENKWTIQSSSGLVSASLGRCLFFILFLLCHWGDSKRGDDTTGNHDMDDENTAWEVHSDTYSWVLQFALAVTNGYLTNVCFSVAPTLVNAALVDSSSSSTSESSSSLSAPSSSSSSSLSDARPQQIASAVLNFTMSLGLLCGSFASFYYLEFAKSIHAVSTK